MSIFSRFQRGPRLPEAEALTEADIGLAYRLVLGREPDAEGLQSYLDASREGLSLRDLLVALGSSDEFATRRAASARTTAEASHSEAPPSAPSDGEALTDLIDPADVARRYSLEQLNEAADEYYKRIPDPTPLMAKPFAFWHESPQMLHDLGALLGGMHLGKAMRVLDFGAGTCWLTRILAQLQCEPVACDVSASALDIGRRLFEVSPPLGPAIYQVQFLVFDGRVLPVADGSVDRIVCFDAFHHVPNPEDVIREFGRVLKDGGIAGFSEPGRYHSRSPQSQYEMHHHRVLENDIDLNRICDVARGAGFTDLTVRTLTNRELSLAAYNALLSDAGDRTVRDDVWQNVRETMFNRSVFFLHKGALRPDSRGHHGLACHLSVDQPSVTTRAGTPVRLRFKVRNVGDALWLHEGREIFGLVRLGAHLAHADGQLLELDFSRTPLPKSVRPGESIDVDVDISLHQRGQYRLTFDLVSEGVSWFENLGSKPQEVLAAVY